MVRIRERCVPVWVQPPTPEGSTEAPPPRWEMQTLKLRTYGFPKVPGTKITDADADDPNSPNIAWSAPGPTFVMHPATKPGADDGTRFKMRLYNRMPTEPDPDGCVPNVKCNTKGPDAGVDPATGECKVPPDRAFGGFPAQTPNQVVDGEVIEPPNCFHGNNSTNFHFHGFHVSPQLGQDNVGLELRPPLPAGVAADHAPSHGSHGAQGTLAYGHFDFNLDPLRYTQPPGTHWYHAHKHGSTALQVLNGLVGTFEIRGEFDQQLEGYFKTQGGGELVDRLMVVQQLQEKQPGLGGADQNSSVLVNGQANPIVRMAKGEIQRWRFIGATMQASASLRVGFPDVPGRKSPEVRQIAMDGVQLSPENYTCQPFLNNPDCTPAADDSAFNELTAFALAPGNRIDVLVQAPTEAGVHCLVHDITTVLDPAADDKIRVALRQRATAAAGTCGIDPNTGLGPLFTLIVEDRDKPMTFPEQSQFPPMASYLANLPEVTDPSLQKDLYYQMVNQGNLPGSQFWISQVKYSSGCANETLVIDQPQQWTLWNNSGGISHPFHIHQNPFQLLSQSDRTPNDYKYPVWRDTLAIPKAAKTVPPNSNPTDPTNPWGHAKLVYVAKEFTGGFVNHCHILGHEDRGMMHNTQAVCADGSYATTGPVPPGAQCDAEGFCPGDCETGERETAMTPCPAPPPQQSDWPKAYGVP
ncbi:MAG: multicopper oxidase domain-containing protein [Thermoanaerobaculia bacterium]|nr:multicopper oxidase domain-containing protein [Thermoanaerobaculia bacterium]